MKLKKNDCTNLILFLLLICSFIVLDACGTKKSPEASIPGGLSRTGTILVGSASWYGKQFHGRKTASGERFNKNELTAAHKTLPFNTYLEVTNLSNQKKAIVRINDRGPFVRGRILDLSYEAARSLGYVAQGSTRVRAEILKF